MSFVNVSILAFGSLFIAVPVVLHLAMRQKPKEQVFPALRFLKQRQVTNRRKMRLRQMVLLLLRCLAIFLLALALARPSVSSVQMGRWLVTASLAGLLFFVLLLIAVAIAYRRGVVVLSLLSLVALVLVGGIVQSGVTIARGQAPLLLGNQKASVAAAILIDTSPRMQLRFENQSRMERAQEVAHWLLRQFPKDSQVAIVDRTPAVFSVDLGAAHAAVDALSTRYQPIAWVNQMRQALELLDSNDKSRKELYLLSDLTKSTWKSVQAGSFNLAEQLAESPDTIVHVIDLGVEAPSNTAITDVQLSQSTLTPGAPLTVRAKLSRTGPSRACSVQLLLEPPGTPMPLIVDGELEKPSVTVRGTNHLEIQSAQDRWVDFQLAPLPLGTHHGYLQLDQEDALSVDNSRHITLHVRAPWPVLLVAGPGAEADQLADLLAPREFREKGRAKYEFRTTANSEFARHRLKDYSAVALLNPTPLSDADWHRLHQYAANGGGVAIFLGRNAGSASQFNSEAATEVLPARLERIWRDDDGFTIAPRDTSHWIMATFQPISATVPWDGMPVFRHWSVDRIAAEANVVVRLSNNQPLMLQRNVGDGRVVMMTTPATDPPRHEAGSWNWLSHSLQPWPFLVLMDRTLSYLVQSRDTQLNYLVGQTATLPVEAGPAQRLTILTPRGTFQELTASSGQLTVPFTDVPGIYRLRLDAESTLPRGFSVNLAAEATRLERIETDDLDAMLGSDRYQLATTEQEIVREIDEARIGREFYPFLLPLVALILAVEYIIACRFYPQPATPRKPLAHPEPSAT